jgi:effector-binding domain-containing protein
VPVASARTIVADEPQLFALLAAVEGYVAAQQARAARPATVVYHGCAADALDVEVAVPLAAPIAGAAWAQPTTLPAMPLVACVVHVGDDAGLLAACAALHAWIDAHGYQLAGPYQERYLRLSGADHRALPPAFVAPHPDAAVTELQVPVVPVQAA